MRYVTSGPTCGPHVVLFPFEAVGTPQAARVILPPALKQWAPPWRKELFSHPAHLWATSDFVPRSEAVGAP